MSTRSPKQLRVRQRGFAGAGVWASACLALWAAGCTSVLGIDGQYISGESTSKGGGGGKQGSSGGEADAARGGAPGGASGEGGAGGDSGGAGGASPGCGTTGAPCPDGQKCCTAANGTDTFCATPEPSIGCSLTSCERCPDPPLNAGPICKAGLCDFECGPGFVVNGAQCDPSGAGGRQGQGGSGTGGAPPPTCDPKKCPGISGTGQGCSIASPVACCTKAGKCGCTYASSLYCF